MQHIRDYHSDLFWDGQSMREFVNQTDQAAVMDFTVSTISFRLISLAVRGSNPVAGTLLALQGLRHGVTSISRGHKHCSPTEVENRVAGHTTAWLCASVPLKWKIAHGQKAGHPFWAGETGFPTSSSAC